MVMGLTAGLSESQPAAIQICFNWNEVPEGTISVT